MRKLFFTVILSCILLGMTPQPTRACTLFAAQGDAWVQGGGSLIVKNRDWRPEWQEVRLVRSHTYAYYGIFGGEDKHLQLKGGVNEKGLAVFSASASSIPKAERLADDAPRMATLSGLLGECASVEEALQQTELFSGAKFLLLADASEIAYVEIAPGGRYAVQKTSNGPLWHTNHYLLPELVTSNVNIGMSSRMRYARIGALLTDGVKPYTLDDFVTFSQDETAGPDNSIWRTGSRADGPQTLATMAVWLPPSGSPEIYVKIRYAPDEAGQEDVFTLDGAELFAEPDAADGN